MDSKPTDCLSAEERTILLGLARHALELAVCDQLLPALNRNSLPLRLQEKGASFVTLTRKGALRGCVGALEPYQPLAEDVREHAIAAALQDFRFSRVRPEELPEIEIEISRLTLPRPLAYECAEDLLAALQPGVHGVVMRDGWRRATFLPQVWEKLPEPEQFLSHLCQKMDAPPDLWQKKKLQVAVYEVEEIRE